ncbi:hypothetical protein FGE12_05650 [Aggregicoccus sp. 17bor-14]|uniref:YiiX/YebB-like N1pC/P60 family cysteine hydrolase n=1 Tax=Myxococcaceae TaxID=31 RepID=UPI00129D19AB|nr:MULTISPECIES: YiiX/YebB-like N1pC/P60 family cysteine hydrolase [Myxococcaceae]MBF5041867.1 hypothetical protein [Simulacricoccus sp. 17bor-14]MRI87648.1 hypothetical protein [Aggregicoccus sp. 17bor-14]
MAKGRGLLQRFLTVFGDIKVFRWPLFMIYDPGSYRVKGQHMREVMSRVQPGDILVRRYDQYLDGHFIPGYFSHVGMYVGKVEPREVAALSPQFRENFGTGEQTVVHAIAEGVLAEDFLNFCRCDGLVVLRFPELLRRTWTQPRELEPALLAGLSAGELDLYARLQQGDAVDFAKEAWPLIRRAVLAKLGTGYDFEFDFRDFSELSCSELVFYATRCLAPFLGVMPEEERVLFLRRQVIAPDAFVRSALELAWKSPSLAPARLEALRPAAQDAAAQSAARAA